MPDAPLGPRFRGVLALEDVPTSDKRRIAANETGWRPLPLTLMALTKASHGGMPSTETEYAGVIDLVERRPLSECLPITEGVETVDLPGDTLAIYYEGSFDTDEVGTHTAGLVERRVLRGISIDFAADEEFLVTEEDEDGWPVDGETIYRNVEIGMATACPFPAFAGCYIELAEPAADLPEDEGRVDVAAARDLPGLRATPCESCASDRGDAVVAAGGPVDPPAAWFTDPQLTGPTAITIEDDGRIYGHLATWGECHVGISGQCVVPPRSASNYARFRVGQVRTAEGTRVATGALFMGTAHATTRGRPSLSAVQDHYADTGTATADVAAGEDAHGIWVAGAMRPDLTPEQVRAARGSVLSGDWRTAGGQLDLLAALHVNVGGFGIPRAELVASAGQPVALVAAGARTSAVTAERQRKGTGQDVAATVRDELQRALAPLLEPLAAARREQARARVAQVVGQPPALVDEEAVADRAAAARARLAAAGVRTG
jgi:hypothetical protein